MRLVASDLDGTLLGPESRLTGATIDALRRAHDAGIAIVAATGRSHLSAARLIAPAGVIDWAVCSNGATRFSTVDDRVDQHFAIAPDTLASLFDTILAALPGAAFAWERPSGVAWDAAFVALQPPVDEMRRPDAGPPVAPGDWPTDAIKVLVVHPDYARMELLAALEECLPEGVTPSCSGAPFVELTGPGVDKAFGLRRLCEQLGVAANEVIAFGDQQNDLAMLRWAGTGVAVANAHEVVHTVADATTASNADDGVAAYLHRLLDAQ